MKTAAVTETWNTAAAVSNRRRARGLASRALDSSGECGFILLAQTLSRLAGGFVTVLHAAQFPVLGSFGDYPADSGRQ